MIHPDEAVLAANARQFFEEIPILIKRCIGQQGHNLIFTITR